MVLVRGYAMAHHGPVLVSFIVTVMATNLMTHDNL